MSRDSVPGLPSTGGTVSILNERRVDRRKTQNIKYTDLGDRCSEGRVNPYWNPLDEPESGVKGVDTLPSVIWYRRRSGDRN